jgi:hypothetical protein
MTGKAWMATLVLALVVFVLTACGNDNKNRDLGSNLGAQVMTCERYQNMVNCGFEYRFENGYWVAYSNGGDRYVLTPEEVRAGYIFNYCEPGTTGYNQYQYRNYHRKTRYSAWQRGHTPIAPRPDDGWVK